MGSPRRNLLCRSPGSSKCPNTSISGVMIMASTSSHHTHSACGNRLNASRIAGNFPHTACVVRVITYDAKSTVIKSYPPNQFRVWQKGVGLGSTVVVYIVEPVFDDLGVKVRDFKKVASSRCTGQDDQFSVIMSRYQRKPVFRMFLVWKVMCRQW